MVLNLLYNVFILIKSILRYFDMKCFDVPKVLSSILRNYKCMCMCMCVCVCVCVHVSVQRIGHIAHECRRTIE